MNRVHNIILTSTLIGCILLAIICLSLTTGITPVVMSAVSQPATDISSEILSNNLPCRVSKNYPDSIHQWCGLITLFAEQNNLSPDLIAALIWQESGGEALAYSKSGAVGLMQVMPHDGLAASFQCPNGPCFVDRPSIAELQDPTFNIAFGTQFLSGLVNKLGTQREALKAYGPHDVGYSYADKVLRIYETYQE